ncbi:hypothetical protein N8292_03825 [Gammaproteobacteria bacterium]|nr:hypothetical protein [Gammaproteobacteria bacterium]
MISLFVNEIFDRLNKANIQYAILRNYENLPHKPSDTEYFDLDLLVASRDLNHYLKLVYKIAKKNKLFIVQKIDREYVKTLRVVHIDENGNVEAIQLDSHIAGQNWWGFFYLTEDEIFSQKKNYKSYYVVSNFHQNLFNWLDKLFFGNYVKQKYKIEILKSLNANQHELLTFLYSVFGKKTADDLASKITDGNLQATLKNRSQMIHKLKIYSIRRFPKLTFISNIKFYYFELMLYLYPPGLCCVFHPENRQIIDFCFNQCKTVYLGDQMIIKFDSASRLSWLRFYFRNVFPIVRKGGMVFVETSKNTSFFKTKEILITKSKKEIITEIFKSSQRGIFLGSTSISICQDYSFLSKNTF